VPDGDLVGEQPGESGRTRCSPNGPGSGRVVGRDAISVAQLATDGGVGWGTVVRAAAALFQVISQRHLKTSIVLTTNR